MKGLAQISVIVTGIRVLSILMQSAIMLYLANSLPIEDMGVYALCYAAVGLVRLLGPLGLDQVNMRTIAEHSGGQVLDPSLQRLLNSSYLLVLGSSFCLATIFSVLALIGNFTAGLTQPNPLMFFILAWSIPAFALIGLFVFEIRAFGHQVSAQIPDSLLLQVFLGCGLLVSGLLSELDLAAALLWLTISAWLVAIIYVLMRLKIGVLWSAKASWGDVVVLLQESKDVLAAKAITVLSMRVPLFLSAPMLGTAGTAILDLAFRFGTLPSLTTTSVSVTFSPHFAALIGRNNTAQLSRALSLASLLATVPALLCFAIVAIAGPFLIETLLPPAYQNLYAPMLVVCAASTINATYGIASELLFMAQKSRIVSVFSTGRLVSVLALCPLLAEPFGIVGFAIAILIGTAARDVGMAIWTSRNLGTTFPPLGIIRFSKR
jgi:O-antigen/teichoic acid export membrane protein